MFKNLDLVILAGGFGSRLGEITKDTPKPMLRFRKYRFIDYLLMQVSKYSFNKIYIIAGYKGHKIYKKYNKKKINLTKIEVLVEKIPRGTGGALLLVKKKISKNFILMNGDSFFDLDFKKFFDISKKKKIGCIALVKNNTYKKNKILNSVTIHNGNIIFSKNSKYMNGGIYFLSKKIYRYFPKKNYFSLENEVLNKLINKKKISGAIFKSFFLDIGTKKNYKSGKKLIPKIFLKPAAFLDRDGVINYDLKYVNKYKDFKFRKNVLSGLKFLIKKNYYIFIVTNQSGIGKAIFPEKNFFLLHKKLSNLLSKEKIFFNDIKFSPFHPNSKIKKYKKNSIMRKPGNGMVKELFKSWNIKKNKSFVLGDKSTDYLMAKKSRLYFEYASNDFNDQVKKIHKKLSLN
jgi:D-glycero-D-manno-heptose 1,7-bisphosphate phosphatase